MKPLPRPAAGKRPFDGRRLRAFVVGLALLGSAGASVAAPPAGAAAVFARNQTTLLTATLQDAQPRYAVRFAFDPATSPNAHRLNRLCYELLESSGFKPFSIVAGEDGLEFRVAWDGKGKKMSIESSQLR